MTISIIGSTNGNNQNAHIHQIPPPPPSSSSPPLQAKLSIHSGNGKLHGGGIRPTDLGTFVKFSQKIKYRIGPVLLICLATVGTVLVINGLYHESTRGAIIRMIEAMKSEILLIQQYELAQFAGIETSSTREGTENEDTNNNNNGTTIFGGNNKEQTVNNDDEHMEESNEMSTIQNLIRRRKSQMDGLEESKHVFQEMDMAIWTLVILSALGLLLTGLAMAITKSRKRTTINIVGFWIIALFIGILLMVELLLLLFFLLPNSIALSSNVLDRLFDEYLNELSSEKRSSILGPIEDEFACKLNVEHELLEKIGLQEKCIPKIKDRLFAPYIVIFLVLVVISPLIFTLFTSLWAIRLKDWEPMRNARKRIELNQRERRPYSREEILSRAIGSVNSPKQKKEELDDKFYY